jgi:hypothetical protein
MYSKILLIQCAEIIHVPDYQTASTLTLVLDFQIVSWWYKEFCWVELPWHLNCRIWVFSTMWVFLLLHNCSSLSDLFFGLYHSHVVSCTWSSNNVVPSITYRMVHWTKLSKSRFTSAANKPKDMQYAEVIVLSAVYIKVKQLNSLLYLLETSKLKVYDAKAPNKLSLAHLLRLCYSCCLYLFLFFSCVCSYHYTSLFFNTSCGRAL